MNKYELFHIYEGGTFITNFWASERSRYEQALGILNPGLVIKDAAYRPIRVNKRAQDAFEKVEGMHSLHSTVRGRFPADIHKFWDVYARTLRED